jgi:hypothetical protein
MNKYQATYIAATEALALAEQGLAAELVASGLQARFDALDENDYDTPMGIALSEEIDAVAAKWQTALRRKDLHSAETALLDWSLALAEKLKPSARADIAILRLKMHYVKEDLLNAAMRLPA